MQRRIAWLELSAAVLEQAGDELLLRVADDSQPSFALEAVTRRCLLSFHDVIDAAPDEASLRGRYPEGLPHATEVIAHEPGEWLLLSQRAIIDQSLLEDARLEFQHEGQPVLGFQWNAEGTRVFREATAERIDKRLAAMLDGRVLMAPVVRSRVGRSGVIEGDFTVASVRALVGCLRSGPLPVALRVGAERRFDSTTPAPEGKSQRELAPSRSSE
jgi:preprotein translocase subunit SecD